MFITAKQLVTTAVAAGATITVLTIGGGVGAATAAPTAPVTPTTTTAPAPPSQKAPAKPGTVHPNVSAGDCESGGGVVIYNPDGTGECFGGFYSGLEVF